MFLSCLGSQQQTGLQFLTKKISGGGEKMRSVFITGVSVLVLSLIIGGCSLFPSNKQTRPAPVRPKLSTPNRVTPSPTPGMPNTLNKKVRPAPTKRIKGVASITEKHLMDRLIRIEESLTKGNWSMANREVNSFGLDMAKYQPTHGKVKSLPKMGNFDVIYGKLQTEIKAKNKTAALRDTRRLMELLKTTKKSA